MAPKTGGDPRYQGNWPEVPQKVAGHLDRNVIVKPWADAMALLASIMVARRFEVSSVLSKIVTLHSRFTSLFPFLGLARMEEWDPAQHIPMYLKAEVLADDPLTVRQRFWVGYNRLLFSTTRKPAFTMSNIAVGSAARASDQLTSRSP